MKEGRLGKAGIQEEKERWGKEKKEERNELQPV